MAEALAVELVCEDRAQQSLLTPLILRAAKECSGNARIHEINARGGASKVHAALELRLRRLSQGTSRPPVAIIVALDANCTGHREREQWILDRVAEDWRDLVVPACPSPHIERWYLVDQDAFLGAVGGRRLSVPEKCDRLVYKQLLRDAMSNAGAITAGGGVEFGPDIAERIDPYRFSRLDPSFKSFWDRLVRRFREVAGAHLEPRDPT